VAHGEGKVVIRPEGIEESNVALYYADMLTRQETFESVTLTTPMAQ
jgi:hypothetical protein